MGADREAAALRRELLRKESVADRMLRRAAEIRETTFVTANAPKRHKALRREPDPEEDAADAPSASGAACGG